MARFQPNPLAQPLLNDKTPDQEQERRFLRQNPQIRANPQNRSPASPSNRSFLRHFAENIPQSAHNHYMTPFHPTPL
jgi:hypothetical protein